MLSSLGRQVEENRREKTVLSEFAIIRNSYDKTVNVISSNSSPSVVR